MNPEQRLATLRDEEARECHAIRREERRMAREVRRMQRGLDAFDEDEAGAERSIEAEWRIAHFGREPDRAPAWRKR